MKVFLYYNTDGILYGFTDNKKLDSEFREFRNPDSFCRKVLDLSDSQFMSLKAQHPKHFLTACVYPTKIELLGVYRKKNIVVVGPIHEEENVYLSAEKFISSLSPKSPFIATLNDDILQALHEIDYWEVMKMSNWISPIPEEEEILSQPSSGIEIDYWEVFMFYYEKTIRM